MSAKPVVMIIVDTNSAEDQLWQGISNELMQQGVAAPPTRSRLDLGDVELVHSEGGAPVRRILIERKGWADWAASMSDGRYKEQKGRALGASDHEVPTTFMYIIENATTPRWLEKTRGMNNRALMAADLKTQLRDGLSVFHTTDTADTARVITYLHRELVGGNLQPKRSEDAVAPVAGVYKRKAACISDGQSQYKAMLAVVHGMSQAKSVAIANAFPSFVDLVNADVEQLANVKVANRRLGNVVAERLRAALEGRSN